MLAENKKVHALWIGKKLTNLELLTIKSFISNGHEFNLWIYDKIETPLPSLVVLKDANEIIPYEKVFSYKYSNQYGHGKGSYAGFSDIFRYALLYKYGGWWVDMDVTCLKPLDFQTPFVFRKHHEFNVVGNIMKCPAKSEFMKDCYYEAIATIDSNNKDWNKPIEILNKYIKKHSLEQYIFDFTNEDKWTIVSKMLYKDFTINQNYYAIHWVNEEWRRHKINKNIALNNSLYFFLLKQYNIDTQKINFLRKIILRLKLTKLYSITLLVLKPKTLKIFVKNFFKRS